MTYKLIPVNNTLEPSAKDGIIRYKVRCGNKEKLGVMQLIVDISALGDSIQWEAISGKMEKIPEAEPKKTYKCSPKRERKTIVFTFEPEVDVETRKDKDTQQDIIPEFIFSIENIGFIGAAPASPVDISFSLVDDLGDKIEGDYEPGKILINTEKPVIRSFKIYPSIIKDNEDICLYLDCDKIDSYNIVYAKNNSSIESQKLLPVVDKKCKGVIEKVKMYKKLGDTLYLEAKLGDRVAAENSLQAIKFVNDVEWHSVGCYEEIPTGTGRSEITDMDISNIVMNEYDNKLWGLIVKKGAASPVSLWYSNDGISWQPYLLSRQETSGDITFHKVNIPDKETRCAHWPAVHFQKKIYFICGSKVDMNDRTSDVFAWDYANNDWQKITTKTKIPPRSLHTCVVFPYKGNDNIWVIGGVDQYGNALKDIWRFDGNDWHNDVQLPNDFIARCRAGATVRMKVVDEEKGTLQPECIWIAGGCKSYDGDTLSDMWTYDGTSWSNVQAINDQSTTSFPLKFTDLWMNAAGIAFLNIKGGKELSLYATAYTTDSNGNSGAVYRRIKDLGNKTVGTKTVHAYSMADNLASKIPNDIGRWLEKSDSFTLTTVGFNGCVWMMAHVYKGKGKIEISQLYYSCPR